MKKTLGLLVLIACVIGALFYFNIIKLSSDMEEAVKEVSQDVESLIDVSPEPAEPGDRLVLTQFVPDDTFFYMGGIVDKKLMDFMADYPTFYLGASDRAAIQNFQRDLKKDSSSQAKFLNYLIDDFRQHVDGTLNQYVEHYGFATEGEFAVYMHGLVPVVNIAMDDPSKLVATFENASRESELSYLVSEMGDVKLMRWSIDNKSTDLVLAVTDSRAVVTLIMKGDDDRLIKERIGQKAVAQPFTTSVTEFQQKYRYTSDLVSVFHLERLLLGLLKAEDSSLARDIERYIPEESYRQLVKADSSLALCQTDISNWVASAPRMAMGYRDLVIDSNEMTANVHSIWEINNALVKEAFQQMQGRLASHVLTWNEQALSVGLATDVSALAPALTTLWQEFTEAEVSCEPLKQAQKEAKQVSPMMMGVMTGMAQGLKGVSLSVFDLKLEAKEQAQIQLDAVLTVEADNPSTLLSLLQMAPELEDIDIPTDGTEAEIALPLPGAPKVMAGVKGSHIVVHSGNKGRQVREQIATETLEANALGLGMAIDYKKLLNLVADNDLLAVGGEEGMCAETLSMIDQFNYMDMKFLYHPVVDEDGLALLMKTSLPKVEKPNFDINYQGNWQTSYLDETCQWFNAGIEQINVDSGFYAEMDETASCDVFKTAYTWHRDGAQIVMKDSEATQSRDSCGEDWTIDEEMVTLNCELMHVETDSFICLFHGDETEPFVQRYTRQ